MNRVTRQCLVLALLFGSFALRAQSIFPVDTVHQYTLDCDAMMNICVPLPAGNLSQYSIFLDGQPYSAGVAGCDFDTTVTYSYNTLFGLGNLGPYHLDSWYMNNEMYEGTFQNINELVALLNSWDPTGGWVHEPSSLSIKGGSSGITYSSMQVTVMMNNTPSTIGLNFGLIPQGTAMQFEAGMHQLIVYDNQNGVKDTLMVHLQCLLPPPPMTFVDTIQADSLPYSLCLDTSELVGNFVSVFNACPDDSGFFVNFYLDETNLCVKYQGLLCGGTETACYVVCDDLGLCDTTFFTVTVDVGLCERVSQKVIDSLLINFTETMCIDTTFLPGNIISVENICPDESGESVVFEYDEDTHCVTYTAIAPGLNQGCYLLTDNFGNTDTVFVCVQTLLPEAGTIIDTILIGLNETYCIDTTELAGNILSIENFCPALSGDAVEFTLDGVNLCVEAQSVFIGTDTACIVICDDYGVCDTTYLYITVVPDGSDPCAFALPPDAVDDVASTLLNTQINIDILANDDLHGCLNISLTVLNANTGGNGPDNGLTVLNPNQSVTYVPFNDFCGQDQFEYVLCNENGCDTAMVTIDIACSNPDSIIIYNGFSPNGDGFNEFFKIENIENHPDNEVMVYNRWGNLVFETTGYQNNWNGMYKGTSLPDGTYFYLIYINGRRQEYTGHLQINR